jgi:hypothetical protein
MTEVLKPINKKAWMAHISILIYKVASPFAKLLG